MTGTPLLLCGVDEAGRGPLVGAVVAAAVILDPARPIKGLADSKKLAASRREQLASQIRENALCWALGRAEASEIDEVNILQASLLAMRRAICQLKHVPHKAMIDGLHCPRDLPCLSEAVVKGDSKIAEISAASILAKTARDAEMLVLHNTHPEYGFDRHKGYPTAEHLSALRKYGILSEHRKSFGPVKVLLTGERG